VLNLLVDTSVWLDLARLRGGQTLIVPIRLLIHWGRLRLLVPSIVLDEFDRNRPSAEERVTKSVSERFKELRRDLKDYGGERSQEWLDEMTHHVPMLSAKTLQNFREIRELLEQAGRLETSDREHQRVIDRGLNKRAPFHHLSKNNVADALIIELYSTAVQQGSGSGETFAFVTSDQSGFSIPNGDQRLPHPDFADVFNGDGSRYCLGVNGLRDLLIAEFGEEFEQEAEEIEFLQSEDEPRTYGEIFEASEEYFDKVWYVRSLILREQIEDGHHEPLAPDIAAGAEAARRRIEERYGAENVGPWDDWHWGFVNGKLSALRWVLGSEWDFLDT
jgi:hypothetical protein